MRLTEKATFLISFGKPLIDSPLQILHMHEGKGSQGMLCPSKDVAPSLPLLDDSMS